MGTLSRLFGKKSYDSVKEFEKELISVQKKNSKMLGLIGTGGRLKGLPLVYATEDEDLFKKYAARLNEIVKPIKVVTEGKKIHKDVLWFEENVLYYKPITEDVAFFAIADEGSDISSIGQWIDKKAPNLEKLFLEKE